MHAAAAAIYSLAAVGLSAAPVAAEDTAAMAAAAAQVFGKQPRQIFDANAVARDSGPARTDTMTLTLAPSKGAELTLDMHGELPDAKDEYTS
jgi:hypothetical protein